MTTATQYSFLNSPHSRRVVRTLTVFAYFIIFQCLILLQKPFLQFDFALIFYSAFGVMFANQLFYHLRSVGEAESSKSGLVSYLFDFLILILFMKSFPYLSSFVLVLQLFLLFVSSFDLDFFELCLLGFVASLGASLVNLSSYQSGSVQSILSLTLFNLSYLSVIIISRQLRVEFFNLQTDLTQTRRKWRSQEQFLNTLIEKLPFGMAVFDRENEIVMHNSYLSSRLQLPTDKMKELILQERRRAASGLEDVQLNKRTINIDRSDYFDEEVQENLRLYLLKDVTEMRSLEQQLRQSEKLAAVGQLAAGIAHEIRNPLAGISGSIQMLSQEYSHDPEQKKLMDIVIREIDRLNLLITDFLNYAKPEKVPDQVVNLRQILEEVNSITKRHPEVSANFVWNIELKDENILGFSEKLKQAFLNIYINAIQAMKGQDSPRLDISLSAEASWAVLSIRDYGSGMNEETREKMFEPFHTTKPKGTGLGLAITHKILEVHRAKVEVRSELNQGTEFIIKFPLAGTKEESK